MTTSFIERQRAIEPAPPPLSARAQSAAPPLHAIPQG